MRDESLGVRFSECRKSSFKACVSDAPGVALRDDVGSGNASALGFGLLCDNLRSLETAGESG
jgi:hypothetical protein